jgi:hypothetical protein
LANDPIRWAAQIDHVREISLLGTADLAYWRERLAAEGLSPAELDGRAQILITAAEMKFKGVRFREVSFSVFVEPTTPSTPTVRDGLTYSGACFLLHAFNSVRFFAFCEHVLFKTPYSYADVRVGLEPSVGVEIFDQGQQSFHAEMHTERGGSRPPERTGEGGWCGPVYLPHRDGKPAKKQRHFIAQLSGHTETYPFLIDQDTLLLKPASAQSALEQMRTSNFAPTEWRVRRDAKHCKSKTYSST